MGHLAGAGAREHGGRKLVPISTKTMAIQWNQPIKFSCSPAFFHQPFRDHHRRPLISTRSASGVCPLKYSEGFPCVRSFLFVCGSLVLSPDSTRSFSSGRRKSFFQYSMAATLFSDADSASLQPEFFPSLLPFPSQTRLQFHFLYNFQSLLCSLIPSTFTGPPGGHAHGLLQTDLLSRDRSLILMA